MLNPEVIQSAGNHHNHVRKIVPGVPQNIFHDIRTPNPGNSMFNLTQIFDIWRSVLRLPTFFEPCLAIAFDTGYFFRYARSKFVWWTGERRELPDVHF